METNYFFSYVRKGVSRFINEEDTPDVKNGSKNRPQIKVDSKIENKTFSKSIKIAGPGDVLSINANAIMRTFPKPHKTIKKTELPYIEFWEPDFAWRYTPAKANGDTLRPWIALVVCEEGKCSIEVNKKGTSIVTFNIEDNDYYKQIFPPPQEIHLSAHAQGETEKEATFCRILNLRTKEAAEGKSYKALLIPVFETGRLRGLDYDEKVLDETPAQQCAWEEDLDKQKEKLHEPFKFPVYYHWSFSVAGETFHALAQKLKSNGNVSDGIKIDVTTLGNGLDYEQLDSNRRLEESICMPAALISTTAEVKAFPPKETPLFNLLDNLLSNSPIFDENKKKKNETTRSNETGLEEDPWITPPIYGAKHVLATSLKGENITNFPWLEQINLDLNYRAAAGLGKKVIQRHQEEFVHRAWEQVESVKEINAEINKEALSANVNTFFKERNVKTTKTKPETAATVVLMTKYSAMRKNIKKDKDSISDVLKQKGISQSFASPLFQKKVQDLSKRNDSIKFKSVMENIADAQILNIPEPKLNAPKLDDLETFCKTLLDELILGKSAISNFLNFPNTQTIFDNLYKSATNKETSSNINYFGGAKVNSFSFGTSDSKEARMSLIWNRGNFPNPMDKNNAEKVINTAITFREIKGDLFSSIGYMIEGDFTDDKYVNDKLDKLESYCSGPIPLYVNSINEIGSSLIIDCNKKNLSPEKINIPSSIKEQIEKNSAKIVYRGNQIHSSFSPGHHDNASYSTLDLDHGMHGIVKQWEKPQPNVFALEATCFKAVFPNVNKPIVQIKLDGDSEKILFLNRDKVLHKSFPDKQKKYFAFYYSDKKEIELDSTEIDKVLAEDGFKNQKELSNENRPILNSYINHYYDIPTYILVKENLLTENCQDYIHTINNLTDYFDKHVDAYKAFISLIETLRDLKPAPKNPSQKPNNTENSEKNKAVETLDSILDDTTTETINTQIITYYQHYFGKDIDNQKKQILNSKYPIMAFPIFPESTYHYLKSISDEFILPGIDDLPPNSISMFRCCPAFIESFLCGMNAEMGRELLWREYPTDQRGSYFRKFWDSDTDSSYETYNDIKNIDTWDKSLGKNHEDSKSNRLVFAIKGELMRSYPDTKITLKRAILKRGQTGPNGKKTYHLYLDDFSQELEPTSQAFIRDDIYVVGFNNIGGFKEALGSPKTNNAGYFLSFAQAPENVTFDLEKARNKVADSSEYADAAISTRETYYKHILTLTNK